MVQSEALVGACAIGSGIVLLRTAILCDDTHCKDYHGWALACSCISLVLCLVVLLLMKFKAGTVDPHLKWIAVFLFVWWCAGVFCMTFKFPYRGTGNGYFGAWIAGIAAWLLLIESWPQVTSQLDKAVSQAGRPWLALLLVASFVVMVQVASDCDEWNYCKEEVAWVLSCSVISLVICLICVIVAGAVQPYFKYIAAFLFLWWCAGTGVATYDRPYVGTGNGYFGCWAAVISAAILCAMEWGADPGANPDDALGKGAQLLGAPKEVLGVCLASLVVVIAAGKLCDESHRCEDYLAWAVACSVISFVITFAIIVCLKFNVAAGAVNGALKYIAAFLVLWWIAGTWCMTFKRPFRHTGNGYFGAWGAVIFSFLLVSQCWGVSGPQLGAHSRTAVLIVMVGSLTVWVQAAMDCDEWGWCKEQLAWALACGVISFVLTAFMLSPWAGVLDAHMFYVALFLFCWWAAGVGVITFDSPYLHTGNAYFGAWAAFLGSAWLLGASMGSAPSVDGGGGGGGGASRDAGAAPTFSPAAGQGEPENPIDSLRQPPSQQPNQQYSQPRPSQQYAQPAGSQPQYAAAPPASGPAPRASGPPPQQQYSAPPEQQQPAAQQLPPRTNGAEARSPPKPSKFKPDEYVQVMWEGSWHDAKIWQGERDNLDRPTGTYTVIWLEDSSHSQNIPEEYIRSR